MPELPEVQTVINTLKTSGLLNKIIIKTNVYRPKILKNCNPIQFNKFMVHEKFINIERIGKYLIFHLSNKKILAIHLRMEGKLFYEPLQIQYKKQHLRIEMLLNNHHVLRFYDSRMFGTFDIYKNDDYLKAKSIKKLALDPLNSKFTWQYLKNQILKSNRALKTTLLDQTLVSGIGNIYADEILFLCKLNPLIRPKALNNQDYKNIVKFAKKVLLKAIKYGGTTVSSYQSTINHSGRYQNILYVHARNGEHCKVCNTIIKKIKVNGRGTCFCPKCQHLQGETC